MKTIRDCLETVRQQFTERAEMVAIQTVNTVKNGLETVGNDLNIYAPLPKSSDPDYHIKMAKRTMVKQLVRSERFVLSPKEPNIVHMNDNSINRFVEEAKNDANQSFEQFVLKMEEKIGNCDSCQIEGDSLWNYSILTVVKNGSEEKWKTQHIINTSKHGKLFNQFPTRKIK